MEAKILIEGEIGAECSLQSVRSQLENFKGYDSIKVLINSQGGEVDEGFAIHDYLVNLGVPVSTNVIGKCYSIATVIFLAGSERTLSENSTFMIHNPWGGVEGDAKTMEQFAEFLRANESKLAQFYSSKTGIEEESLRAMMDNETFMDKKEAREKGFANALLTEFKAVAKLSKQFKKDNMTDKETSKLSEVLNQISDKLSSLVVKNEDPQAKALLLEGSEELGMNIFVEAESLEGAIGAAAFVANEAGESTGEPLADGTYMLADGSAIVVSEGKVIELEAGEAVAKEDEEDEEMKALKAENEELKAKLSEMEAAKAEMEESVKAKESELSEVKASLEGVSKDLEEVKAMTVGKAFAKAPSKEVKKDDGIKLPEVNFGLK